MKSVVKQIYAPSSRKKNNTIANVELYNDKIKLVTVKLVQSNHKEYKVSQDIILGTI